MGRQDLAGPDLEAGWVELAGNRDRCPEPMLHGATVWPTQQLQNQLVQRRTTPELSRAEKRNRLE